MCPVPKYFLHFSWVQQMVRVADIILMHLTNWPKAWWADGCTSVQTGSSWWWSLGAARTGNRANCANCAKWSKCTGQSAPSSGSGCSATGAHWVHAQNRSIGPINSLVRASWCLFLPLYLTLSTSLDPFARCTECNLNICGFWWPKLLIQHKENQASINV